MSDYVVRFTGQDNLSGTINKVNKELGSVGEGASKLDKIMDKFNRIDQSAAPLKKKLRDLQQIMAQMNLDGLTGTDQFTTIAEKAGQLKDAIGDASAAVRQYSNDTFKLQAGIEAFQGITAAATVATGVMGLLGTENEKVEQAILKVQSAMAIMNGVQQIANTLNKDSALMLRLKSIWTAANTTATGANTVATGANTVATIANTAAQRAWNYTKAIGKALFGDWTGLVLVGAAALGTYALATSDASDKEDKHNKKLKESEQAVDKYTSTLNSTFEELVTSYAKLKSEWNSLSTVQEKNQWIKDNQTKFEDLSISVNKVSDAENVFNKNTSSVLEAFKARAKAAASLALLVEEYKNQMQLLDKINTIQSQQQQEAASRPKVKAGQKITDSSYWNKRYGSSESGDWRFSEAGAKLYNTGISNTNPVINALNNQLKQSEDRTQRLLNDVIKYTPKQSTQKQTTPTKSTTVEKPKKEEKKEIELTVADVQALDLNKRIQEIDKYINDSNISAGVKVQLEGEKRELQTQLNELLGIDTFISVDNIDVLSKSIENYNSKCKVAHNQQALMNNSVSSLNSNLSNSSRITQNAAKSQQEHNDSLDRGNEVFKDYTNIVSNNITSLVTKYFQMRTGWLSMSDAASKNEWIIQNTQEFYKLGLNIKNTTDATRLFENAQYGINTIMSSFRDSTKQVNEEIMTLEGSLDDLTQKYQHAFTILSKLNPNSESFNIQLEVVKEYKKAVDELTNDIRDKNESHPEVGSENYYRNIIQELDTQLANTNLNSDDYQKILKEKVLQQRILDRQQSYQSMSGRYEYYSKQIEEAKYLRDIGVISYDEAYNRIKSYNNELSKLKLQPIEVELKTDWQVNIDNFKKNAQDVTSTFYAMDDIYNSVDRLTNSLRDGASAWEIFINTIQLFDNTINSLQSSFNLINKIANLFDKDNPIKGINPINPFDKERRKRKEIQPDKMAQSLQSETTSNLIKDTLFAGNDQLSDFENYIDNFKELDSERMTSFLNSNKEIIGGMQELMGVQAAFTSFNTANTQQQVANASTLQAANETQSATTIAGIQAQMAQKALAIAADTTQTGVQVTNAGVKVAANTAEAVSGATASGAKMPFPANLLAIAAGVAAVMSVLGSISGMFADGGIIGGNTYHGDKILARVNAGEMVLNKKQQSNLFSMLDRGGTTGRTVEFKIKGSTLQGVLDNYNNKKSKIR